MAKPPPGAFQGFHRFKLGKKPARRGSVKFKLKTYLVKHQMPTPPKEFGHQSLIGSKKDALVGKIQERYGNQKEAAEKEVDDFINAL